jgi:AraC-like DNA-binding protein
LKRADNIQLNTTDIHRPVEIYDLKDIERVTLFDNYRRYDFFQLLWLKEVGGNPFYFLDFNEYTLTKDQIILIYPGQIDYMPDIYSKEGYLFAFEQSLFHHIVEDINSDYLNGYTANIFISLDKDITVILEKLMELILPEYKTTYRIPLLESYLQAFLFHISSLYEGQHNLKNRDDILITELMKLIDLNFINEKEVSFYAGKLGVTNKKLTRLCIKKTGKTIKQYILGRLVLEIKKEIFKSEKSLKEIAFDLNFSEPAYFTRFFKKHTSMTPEEFRREMTISPSKRP